jgi:hypothetical protein
MSEEGRIVVDLPLELRAVRAFLVSGSYAATAREMGVPVAVVKGWSTEIWWQEEVAALQRDMAAKLDSDMTRILNFSLDQLLNRITCGDTVVMRTKEGIEEVQVPLKADTLARIADVVFTKRQLLRNQPTAIAGDTKKLNTLALKLKALGARDVTILEDHRAKKEEK